jgi:uncharacterized protein (DUF697 family)
VIATPEELESVREACRLLVRRRARAAAALAAVPWPGVDLAGDMALLMAVIPVINRRFGLDHSQIEELDNTTKMVVYQLMRRAGTRFVGQAVTVELITAALSGLGLQVVAESVLKYIPVAGTIASGLLAYQIFKRIAYSHIEDCVKVSRDLLKAPEGSVDETSSA